MRLLAVLGLIGFLLVAVPTPASAGPVEDAGFCEPVVFGLTIDWETTPPTVTPFIWIRPECILP